MPVTEQVLEVEILGFDTEITISNINDTILSIKINFDDRIDVDTNVLDMYHHLIEEYVQRYNDISFSMTVRGLYHIPEEGIENNVDSDYEDEIGYGKLHSGNSSTEFYRIQRYEDYSGPLDGMIRELKIIENHIDSMPGPETHLAEIQSMKLDIIIHSGNNTKALPKFVTLKRDMRINKFVEYLPWNNDEYCIMHSIYLQMKRVQKKKTMHASYYVDCTQNDYLNDFNTWFATNDLHEFYNQQNQFLLKKIGDLEERLGISINLYSLNNGGYNSTAQYKSRYLYGNEIINLMIVNYNFFEDHKRTEFIKSESFKNNASYLGFVSVDVLLGNSHCLVVKNNFFKKYKDASVCKFCHGNFGSDSALEDHELKCRDHRRSINDVKERIRTYEDPKDRDFTFKNFNALLQVPFITADTETRVEVTKKVKIKDGKLEEVESRRFKMYSYALCYVNVFNLGKSVVKMYESYDETEVNSHFVEDLRELGELHRENQSIDHHGASLNECDSDKCSVCLQPYSTIVTTKTKKGMKERPLKKEYNHSHFIDDELNVKYNTFMCDLCNKKMQKKNKPLQVYFHNGKNFDFSFVLKALFADKTIKDDNYKIVPKNASKYSSIKVILGENLVIEFKDSILHFPISLDSAIKTNLTDDSDYTLLRKMLGKFYPGCNINELFNLAKKKAPFPYSLLSDEENLSREMSSITIDEFYNDLIQEKCKDDDFKIVSDVCTILGNYLGKEVTLLDYQRFYLLLDTVLLGCVLFKYMIKMMEKTDLNPLEFISLSSFAMGTYKYFALTNELPVIKLPDVRIQQIIKKSIYGGFTYIFNKQNLRGKDDYTMYHDYTSLYPSMFVNKHPYEYVGEVDVNEIQSILANDLWTNDYYYLLDVDIKALKEEFHDKLSCYPLFPENRVVEKEWLSQDQLERYKYNSKGEKKEYKSETKNIVTFFAKKNYLCSARYLKYALSQGYELECVNCIYKFKQDYILKEWVIKFYELKKSCGLKIAHLKIELSECTDEKRAKEIKKEINLLEIVKNLMKLILNAFYGSTIINIDNFSQVEIVDITNEMRLKKNVNSMRFKGLVNHNESGKILIHKENSKYQYSYPSMLGSSILFDSKIAIAKFAHSTYDYLESKNLKLHPIFCDTDSYCFSVRDFKKVFSSDSEYMYKFNQECYDIFDLSTNAKDSGYYCVKNQENLNTFKNEYPGIEIKEVNALCAKVYSIIAGNKEKVKAKGISKRFAQKLCKHSLYESVINGDYKNEAKGTFEEMKIYNQHLNVGLSSITKQYVSYVDLKAYYGENASEYLIFGSKKHLDLVQKKQESK